MGNNSSSNIKDAWHVKKILVFINQGIGDVIHALPMLKTVRKSYDSSYK